MRIIEHPFEGNPENTCEESKRFVQKHIDFAKEMCRNKNFAKRSNNEMVSEQQGLLLEITPGCNEYNTNIYLIANHGVFGYYVFDINGPGIFVSNHNSSKIELH
jgi:hypothetical protein